VSSKQRGGEYSNSLTDLMAGVAAIFLLIAIVFILIAAKRAENERRQHDRVEEQIDEFRKFKEQIVSRLDSLAVQIASDKELERFIKVDNAAARGDKFLLVVVFDRERLSFASEECELGQEQQYIVRKASRLVLQHICDFASHLEPEDGGRARATLSMTLEGHTDRKSFLPFHRGCGVDRISCGRSRDSVECKKLGFENNVRLSAARAQNVFFEMRHEVDGDIDKKLSRCLEKYFVVAGRGPVEPVHGSNWQEEHSDEDDNQNRRVLLKIRVHPSIKSFDVLETKQGQTE
jgi:flagellar motor protein MotB